MNVNTDDSGQFHHAHEAYIVPDLIKSAWNSTPAVAIFATKCALLRARVHSNTDRTRPNLVHGTSVRRGEVASTRPRSCPRTTSPSVAALPILHSQH